MEYSSLLCSLVPDLFQVKTFAFGCHNLVMICLGKFAASSFSRGQAVSEAKYK